MTIVITGFHLAEDMGLEPITSIYPLIFCYILFQNSQCLAHFPTPKNLRLWHQIGTNNKYIDSIKKPSQNRKFALIAQKRRA